MNHPEDILLTNARYAEQCSRFADMIKLMKEYAEKKEGVLTTEERNLLSVAYKNVVGNHRSSYRIITSVKDKQDDQQLPKAYLETIKKDLTEVCMEILTLLETLIEKCKLDSDTVANVFYLKMKGDYYRYLSEVEKDGERTKVIEEAWKAYKDAKEASEKELPSTHPIRLGLALNYSVFLYEIKEDTKAACELAKSAFDDAIAELDSLKEDSYKDSTLIMQLLRDNLTLWTAESDSKDDDDSNKDDN